MTNRSIIFFITHNALCNFRHLELLDQALPSSSSARIAVDALHLQMLPLSIGDYIHWRRRVRSTILPTQTQVIHRVPNLVLILTNQNLRVQLLSHFIALLHSRMVMTVLASFSRIINHASVDGGCRYVGLVWLVLGIRLVH